MVTLEIFDGSTGTITHAADGAADDLTLSLTGAQNSSLFITSTGTAADALGISTSAGGIDITAIGAAGEDIDIDSTTSSVNITGSEAIQDAVVILADAGGVDISSAATFDIDITATGGTVKVIATEAAADQFKVDAQGTVVGDAINLETTDGGIMLNADNAANGDIELNAADDIILTAVGFITVSSGLVLPAEVVTEANTLTADECGLISFLTAGSEFDTALPALSTCPAGCSFEFIITAAADTGSYTVTTDSNETLINGIINNNNTLTACAAEDTITFVTGNNVGDHAKVVSDGTSWIISGEGLAASKLTCTDE